jgi:alcohol dehydrogenase class IV
MEVVGSGKKITHPAAPWIAIPTTAGTGAEATRNAVIGFPERQFKASIRSELLLPRVALIDSELGKSVPSSVTASSGMDALCQLIESYTSTGASPMTDALALQGIPIAARCLPAAYRNGADSDTRDGMALAALLSGMALTNAGLGAVHGFAAPLGANFPVPHGTACAALLPHVVRANVEALRAQGNAQALARYANIGRNLLADESADDVRAIDACADVTAQLAADMNIPSLKEFGVSSARVSEMVALARKSSSMRFNPIALSDEALGKVLIAAIG